MHRCLQRTDRAKRRVRDPRAVTVLAAQDHFSGVVEARTHEQVKAGEFSQTDILPETGLQFLGATQNQFARNAPVVGFLPVEFNPKFVPRCVLPDPQVLPQIGKATGEDFGVLVRAAEIGTDAVLFLGVGGTQPGEADQFSVHLGFFNHQRVARCDGFHLGVGQSR